LTRTLTDINNRRRANRKYYADPDNRETKRAYQRKYSTGLRGPKKSQPVIFPYHEEWAKKNGYR